MERCKQARQKTATGMAAGWLVLFATLLFGFTARAGDLSNTAHSEGTNPANVVISSPQDTVDLPIVPENAAISLVKTVTLNSTNLDSHAQIGETLTYHFTVKNTGNVTLENISVTDPTATVSGGPIASLAPGASDSTTFTATYTLTATDIAAGSHSNQAQVKATSIVTGSTPDAVVDDSHPSDENGDAPTVITFTDAPIVAEDDTFAPVNGYGAGTAGNVLVDNGIDVDSLNGSPATVALTDLSVVTAATPVFTGAAVPVLDIATGDVTVPAQTPAGTYTIGYSLCETLNPTNCDTAIATVVVTAAPIVAGNDTPAPVNGASGTANLVNAFANDSLNGTLIDPLDLSQITATVLTPAVPIGGGPVPALDPATGIVSVPAGTPTGTYTIEYQICEDLNTDASATPPRANCATATVTVDVTSAPIVAEDDTFAPVNGYGAGTAGNVLVDNGIDVDSLNGSPATVALTDLSVVTAATPVFTGAAVPVLDIATGDVTVPAQTPAGTYTIGYSLCETLNPTNCDTAIATVVVTAAPIVAGNDTPAPVNGASGTANLVNAFANDSLNGTLIDPLDLSQITATVLTPAVPIGGGPVPALDPATGIVSVPAGTPTGTYTIEYQICEDLNTDASATPPRANCATATVTVDVTSAPIVAEDDTFAPVNGYGAGTAGNVLVDNGIDVDSLNGSPATVALTDLSVVTAATPVFTGAAVPVLDIATGDVTVPAQTPAGTYTIGYSLCETLNPTNCDTAIATVVVTAAPIVAGNDTPAPVNGASGTANLVNAFANDSLNGTLIDPLDLSQITATVLTPAVPIGGGPVPALDPATGIVSVPAGTPTGTYTIEYQICEDLNTDASATPPRANCATATVTVDVTSAPIVAEDDTFAPVNGYGAGTAGNVLVDNGIDVDSLNGSPATVALTDLSVVTAATPVFTGAAVPVLDIATGDVTVPAQTPAGTYTIGYSLCETLNPTNCDTAIATVVVTAAPIVAGNDTPAPVNGASGTANLVNAFANDSLNGTLIDPLDLSQITATVLTPAVPIGGGPVPALDPATGIVSVPAGTPTGTYTIEYQICEDLNTDASATPPRANCATATVTVDVTSAPIVAEDDTFAPVNGYGAGTAGNVLVDNGIDVDSLNGSPATVALTDLSVVTAATPVFTGAAVPVLDIATGDVTVPAQTPAGTYTIGYSLCETLNPTNCDTAIATVVVTAAPIVAGNDTPAPVNGASGTANLVNAFANDSLNGTLIDPLDLSQITATVLTPAVSIGGGPVPALDPATGIVSVPAGTPAGTYTIEYQICEDLNTDASATPPRANCATATVTVDVTSAPIVAVADTMPAIDSIAGGTTASVLVNDTLNSAPAAVGAGGNVTLNPGAAPTPATGSITMNPDGTITVAPGTTAGTYSYPYEICEILNPANCATAVATIEVGTPAIVAQNDTQTGVNGLVGGTIPGFNVLTNDTLNGTPATAGAGGNVTLVPVTTGPITVNADGSVTVAPNTPTGTYLVTYQICDLINPANCTMATVSIGVNLPENRIAGVIYEDANSNGRLDPSDPHVGGHTVQLIRNGVVVATTTANPDGSYAFTGIPAGSGYSIAAIDPVTGNVITGRGTFNVTPNTVLANINLPLDPSGVVYDSTTRRPVAGAVLQMVSATGTPLPSQCFVSPAQQPQTTGANGQYRFDLIPGANALCPTGQTTYRIRLVPPAGYLRGASTVIPPQSEPLSASACPIDATPGGSCEVQSQTTAPQGADATIYFLSFLLASGNPHVVHNHIPLDPIVPVPGDVSVTKTSQSQVGMRGGVMGYTIVATNNGTSATAAIEIVDTMPAGFALIEGSGRVNGVAATPVVDGRAVTFPGIVIPAGGRTTIKLTLRIPVNASVGEYANLAAAQDPATGRQIGTGGKAIIRIEPEAVFDCSDVIGKVFDDKDANGYQDKGETGLPGVRLATVNGELITTDKNGQFHVPCAMLPDKDIGSNFILKLDTRTLPTGYRLTTENPRVVRLTAGKMVKLNFGATIGRVVRLDVADAAFVNGETGLKPEWDAGISELVGKLSEKPSTLRLTYQAQDEGRDLVSERVSALKKLIEKRWKREGGGYQLPIEVEIVR